MKTTTYHKVRSITAAFIAAIVSISVIQETPLLAGIAVVTGIIFLTLVRSKTKIVVDEREIAVRQKAAQLTYAIFSPTLGISAFLLITFGRKIPYIFALGQVLAYLTLFMITVYAISFYFLNRQYLGPIDE